MARKPSSPPEDPDNRVAGRPNLKAWALALALAIALAQGPLLAVDAETMQTLPWWGGLVLATLRFILLWFCAHVLTRVVLRLVDEWWSD